MNDSPNPVCSILLNVTMFTHTDFCFLFLAKHCISGQYHEGYPNKTDSPPERAKLLQVSRTQATYQY